MSFRGPGFLTVVYDLAQAEAENCQDAEFLIFDLFFFV
jgi:hypothetical protein